MTGVQTCALPISSLSAYGHGSWFHFVDRLYYATGLPQFCLWILGSLGGFFYIFSKKEAPQYKRVWVLIFGYFFVLLIAHSAFWYFGIFNSFGLARVVNTVMPEFALIALLGFNWITDLIRNQKIKIAVQTLLIMATVLMPFSKNKAAIFFPKMFVKAPDQIVLTDITNYIRDKMPSNCVFYSNPCVPFYLNADPYDDASARSLGRFNDAILPDASIIVWDNIFSVLDHNVSLEMLRQDARFEEIKSWQTADGAFQFTIFKKR